MNPDDLLKKYASLYHSVQAVCEYLNIPEEHRGSPDIHFIIIEFIKQPQTSYKAIKQLHEKHMAEKHPKVETAKIDILTALLEHGV
jgi:hypothetical protein